MVAAVAQVSTVTLSGSPGVGDVITVTVDENTVTYTVVETDIGEDDAASLANIAAKVAAAINDDAEASGVVTASASAADVTLTADVAGLAGAFTLDSSVAVIPASDLAAAAAETAPAADEVAQVSTITLSGFPQVGDEITVIVAGAANPVPYIVVSGDISGDNATTLANIAAKVAFAINDDDDVGAAGDVVTATSAAAVVTLTEKNPDGSGFGLTCAVAGGDLAAAVAETVATDAAKATLSVGDAGNTLDLTAVDAGIAGNEITYETATLGVSETLEVSVEGTTITVTLVSADGLITTSTNADVADLLNTDVASALLVDAAVSGVPTTLASVSGITSLTGGSDLTAEVNTVTLSGSPRAGEVITVTVKTIPVTYTVVSEDIVVGDNDASLANIAAKVVIAINADGTVSAIVIATSVDAVVTLTAVDAGLDGAFTLDCTITPAVSTVADNVVAAADAVPEVSTITLSGSPREGDVITVTVAGAANPVTHTVVEADIGDDDAISLANIATAVAGAIDADTYAGPIVDAAAPGAVVTLTAVVPGLDGAFTLDSSVTGIPAGDLDTTDAQTAAAADAGMAGFLFKSTAVSGGRTWAATGYNGGPVVDMVCSELSEDVIYVTDGNYVYKSVTGGTSFNFVAKDDLEKNLMSDCGIPITGDPITSIDVGYDGANKPVVFIGTVAHETFAGSVYWIADESFPAQWTDLELGCYGVGWDVYAVGCAPDFATSNKTYVVTTNTSLVETHIISTIGTTCSWTFVSELVYNCAAANNFDISHASRIAFPSYYGTSPTLFVGVVGANDGLGGDVYSVTASSALDLNVAQGGGCEPGTTTDICSLDILNDALVAGANDDTNVYYSADNGWNWTASKKDPTGASETYVLFAGDSVLAATAGTDCAVSMSCGEEDIGKFWNQISLIDMAIVEVLDLSHAPGYLDGSSTMYVLTTDQTTTSLLRWDGDNWERVFSSSTYDAEMDWVEVSPDFGTTDCVYLASTDFQMFRSMDQGCSWTVLTYPCFADRVPISAWIVVDEETVLAAGGAGTIYKTTKYGTRPWDAFPVPTAGVAAGDGIDFDLSPNIANDSSVLFGDDNGQVYLSGDLGATWTTWVTAPIATNANTYVQFDPGYGTSGDPGENMIYAAAGTVIARCDVSKGVEAVALFEPIGSAGEASGIAAAGDTALYVADAGAGVWRSLNPIAATTVVAAEWEFLEDGFSVLEHPQASDDLWLTAGSNMLWALDSGTATIWMWDDVLATPVIPVGPDDEAKIGTTGEATLTWEALVKGAEYEVSLYRYCAECPDLKTLVVVTDTAETCLVVPTTGNLDPGTTYFWQVRVAEGSPFLSKWSELREFDTALGSVLGLCSPSCGASDVILTTNFSWDAVLGATGYEVQIATNEGFSPVIASGTPTVNAWAAAPDLDYSTTYFWRVRAAKEVDVYGAWAVCLFTTMDEPAEPVAPITPVEVITEEITPTWIWVIIGIGAALVIAVIVLIVNTRRVP
ncbi:hypothetical protein ES703_14981 [subsurface metagenome]